MIKLFTEGGVYWMGLLTLEFIGVFLAAWKAPGWVKETGLIALVTGTLGLLVGLFQLSTVVHQIGDISRAITFGGLRVALIAPIYGVLIYLASLIIRIVQKPRIL